VVGVAWAVSIMETVQFAVMLAGGLVIFPVAMHLAGGIPTMWHHLAAASPLHTTIVPATGGFSWLFVMSMMLLGFKFATVDQSILQRAFGARSPRVGAKGMVISGLITVPLAFLWILPGLAVAKIHHQPFVDAYNKLNTDLAIPWLLRTQLPMICVGLLGFVLCGLVAAQVSTITADVNSVATVLTSDVYRTLKRKEPTQRQLLQVVRWTSLLCGIIMLIVAWLFQYVGNAVKLNHIVVGILDMPLFVVTVIYGLAWKRTNWQGALAGFLLGGLGACACYYFDSQGVDHARQMAPIIGTAVALLVTPIVTLLTPHAHNHAAQAVFASLGRGRHDEGDADPFHLIPASPIGKAAALLVLIGFVIFFIGILSARSSAHIAAPFAIAGLLAVLLGGGVRVFTD
jgi:SSS family solute:Na+ symporter